MAIGTPRYLGTKAPRQKQNHCRKQDDDQRSKGQFFQEPLLRQVDLTHFVRMPLLRGIVVDVGLLLVRMIRRRWIVVIGMHMQPHTLDEHQGNSQVGYPDDFPQCFRLPTVHSTRMVLASRVRCNKPHAVEHGHTGQAAEPCCYRRQAIWPYRYCPTMSPN